MKKHFVKSAVLIFSLLICAFSAKAQNFCRLENAPKLLGFGLGMSPAEAQIVAGKNLKIKVKKSGQRIFFQNFIQKPAPNSLRGVRALYLRFLDGKLYQIEFFYEDRSDLTTLADWTAILSNAMNFPAGEWQIKHNRAKIECDTFRVTADKILNPHIELTDKTALAKIEAKQKEK